MKTYEQTWKHPISDYLRGLLPALRAQLHQDELALLELLAALMCVGILDLWDWCCTLL